MDKAATGRMPWTSLSPSVTADASIPMGTLSPIGSTLSHTANIISNTSASQKAGMLAVSSAYAEISLSVSPPFLAPAATPSTNPTAPDTSQADAISHKELASFSPITLETG